MTFKPNRHHQQSAKAIRKARERIQLLTKYRLAANQRASRAEQNENRYRDLGVSLARKGASACAAEHMGHELMRELIDNVLQNLVAQYDEIPESGDYLVTFCVPELRIRRRLSRWDLSDAVDGTSAINFEQIDLRS